VTPEALEAALEATALANEQAVARGEVPHAEEAISRGIKWKPEPFSDGEHFDLADQVLGRGWGDCDDLAPWLAGSMRATGEDPGAIPRVYQSGPGRWHVVVQTSDGQILDPSKWAGMGRRKSQVSGEGCMYGVCGKVAKPFAHIGRGALAVYGPDLSPDGRYWARCDVPFEDTHLASHARSRDPETAIARAIAGAIDCGEVIGADVENAYDVESLLLGDTDELVSVGFLPALAALAPAGISLAKGLLSKKRRAAPGGQAHPGGGVSVPVKKKADQHMMLYYHPTGSPGPVIMRY
jgi:hypothetical protein